MIRILMLCLFGSLLCPNIVFGQARSSLGFALGANQTLNQYDHTLNASIALVGNVRIFNKLAVEPSLGIHEVNDYVSARLSAKYYVANRVFITAGPFFWVGSDIRTGLGTTASAGYRVFNKPKRNFEVSVHGNFARYIYNSTPVIGFRAAYNFSFREM
ncbi:hypothetical protein ACFQ3S_08320 [Mucilaginibacter terrae]|uniref:hypothetical protein n=1 Tax=Mucilaginibacter terrae TaxID=1955052 RepID=UPI003631B5AC